MGKEAFQGNLLGERIVNVGPFGFIESFYLDSGGELPIGTQRHHSDITGNVEIRRRVFAGVKPVGEIQIQDRSK